MATIPAIEVPVRLVPVQGISISGVEKLLAMARAYDWRAAFPRYFLALLLGLLADGLTAVFQQISTGSVNLHQLGVIFAGAVMLGVQHDLQQLEQFVSTTLTISSASHTDMPLSDVIDGSKKALEQIATGDTPGQPAHVKLAVVQDIAREALEELHGVPPQPTKPAA